MTKATSITASRKSVAKRTTAGKTAAKKTPAAKVATKKVVTRKPAKRTEKRPKPVSHGVGRRKCAVARVWLRRGSGKIFVNGIEHTKYFDTLPTRLYPEKPFAICEIRTYDADTNVIGGGQVAQAGAVRLGIANALLDLDNALRPHLRGSGLLTVDSRVKERKKYGQRGARRKFQFVKR